MTLPTFTNNSTIPFLGRHLLKDDTQITIESTSSLPAQSSATDNSPVLVQYVPYSPIVSHSDKLNYRVQAYIYNKLDKAIERTKSLRLPAFLALSTSTLANLILRISSATEMTIHGISHLFMAPFSEDRKSHLNSARVLLVQGPYKALEVVLLPLEVIMDSTFLVFVPKNFIYQRIEKSKVNLIHSKEGTIGSLEYKNDLDDAISKAKRREMNLPD